MRYFLFITILFLSLLFSCTSTQQQFSYKATSLAVNVDSLTTSYTKIKYLLETKQKESNIFTKEEWSKLLDVDSSVSLLMLKYQAIVKLDVSNLNLHDVSLMWTITQDSYVKAKDVVTAHLDQFDSNSQMVLKIFDAEATSVSSKITDLLKDPTTENVQKSVVLIVNVLSLAVKIIGIAAAA
jgi:hypothetical protein